MVKIQNGYHGYYYMDTESFIAYVKTDNIYKDIADYVEIRFDAWNFEIGRHLPKGKSKKVIGLMKDELRGKITKVFAGLRIKTYSYLKNKNDEDKKAKDTKKVCYNRKI